MKELLAEIARWRSEGHGVVLARVVNVEGSGPREAGAAMAVNDQGVVVGSVSGGCVEGAVVEAALEVLASGESRLCTFGYSDDEAFAVGLTCGGTIRIFLERLAPEDDPMDPLFDAVIATRPCAVATIVARQEGVSSLLGTKVVLIDGHEAMGSLGNSTLDQNVAADLRGALDHGHSVTRHYGEHGEMRERSISVFHQVFTTPPKMIIIGAVDFTAALVNAAKSLHYFVTVCDPRPIFATLARFPRADVIENRWPDLLLQEVGPQLGPRDALCVLTHDVKFDVPAIVEGIKTKVGYIGVMGSRLTHEKRVVRLREAGLSDEEIARLASPIGVSIGARTPEETAISIMAEIIALRSGVAVPHLKDASGPIHSRPLADSVLDSWA